MIDAAGAWRPGIGDPTPLGWLTVAAYFVAAAACWRTARRDGRGPWLVIALALVLLGINKQLDLQTALTELGRALARAQGWYEQRRTVQAGFIVALTLAGASLLAALLRSARPLEPGRLLALCGMTFIGVFVLVRASSFHHVDLFLGSTVAGLRWNWVLELGGIAAVLAGAILHRRPARR